MVEADPALVADRGSAAEGNVKCASGRRHRMKPDGSAATDRADEPVSAHARLTAQWCVLGALFRAL